MLTKSSKSTRTHWLLCWRRAAAQCMYGMPYGFMEQIGWRWVGPLRGTLQNIFSKQKSPSNAAAAKMLLWARRRHEGKKSSSCSHLGVLLGTRHLLLQEVLRRLQAALLPAGLCNDRENITDAWCTAANYDFTAGAGGEIQKLTKTAAERERELFFRSQRTSLLWCGEASWPQLPPETSVLS